MENVTEQEQLESLKRWWRENGRAVIAGIVLGLVALFGTRAWLEHRETQAQEASVLYAQALQALAAGQAEQLAALTAQLREDYAGTPYAALAALAAARAQVDAGDLQAAAAQLQWVVDHADPPGVAQIARLRLARVLLADGRPEAALAALGASPPAGFAAAHAEIKGDVHLAQGQHDQARAAYQAALQDPGLSGQRRAVIRMKLNELAGQEAAAS